ARPHYVAFASTSLLVLSITGAHTQALAPSELHLASRDQEPKKETAQVITKKTAEAIVKKRARTITTEPVRAFAIEPVRPIAKPNGSETTQAIAHYSYKTAAGKK